MVKTAVILYIFNNMLTHYLKITDLGTEKGKLSEEDITIRRLKPMQMAIKVSSAMEMATTRPEVKSVMPSTISFTVRTRAASPRA